jgi:hypothetical protein
VLLSGDDEVLTCISGTCEDWRVGCLKDKGTLDVRNGGPEDRLKLLGLAIEENVLLAWCRVSDTSRWMVTGLRADWLFANGAPVFLALHWQWRSANLGLLLYVKGQLSPRKNIYIYLEVGLLLPGGRNFARLLHESEYMFE